ncbi:MAG: DUF4038 domain-containing protein [Vicinamibacteraceae bacterium]
MSPSFARTISIATPVGNFFIHECVKRGLYAAMNPVYAGWYVKDEHVTQANAEGFGRFWGQRYGREPNIMYVSVSKPMCQPLAPVTPEAASGDRATGSCPRASGRGPGR